MEQLKKSGNEEGSIITDQNIDIPSTSLERSKVIGDAGYFLRFFKNEIGLGYEIDIFEKDYNKCIKIKDELKKIKDEYENDERKRGEKFLEYKKRIIEFLDNLKKDSNEEISEKENLKDIELFFDNEIIKDCNDNEEGVILKKKLKKDCEDLFNEKNQENIDPEDYSLVLSYLIGSMNIHPSLYEGKIKPWVKEIEDMSTQAKKLFMKSSEKIYDHVDETSPGNLMIIIKKLSEYKGILFSENMFNIVDVAEIAKEKPDINKLQDIAKRIQEVLYDVDLENSDYAYILKLENSDDLSDDGVELINEYKDRKSKINEYVYRLILIRDSIYEKLYGDKDISIEKEKEINENRDKINESKKKEEMADGNFEFKTEETKIDFSNFDSFDPQVESSDKEREVSHSIKELFSIKNRDEIYDAGDYTYEQTIKKEEWEKELFSFIQSYLEKEGNNIMDNLNIKDIRELTPKQAVELSNEIVIDLTKYNYDYTKETDNLNKIDSLLRKTNLIHTEADNRTTLELLKEGVLMKDDPSWKGNVVCRNCASMVRATFESLKNNQIEYNQLRNVYCIYESGDEFAPQKTYWLDSTSNKSAGHAWNTFLVVLEDSINATITDATWAKRNPDTNEIEKLDFTFSRMEPIVNKIEINLKKEFPDYENQINNIFSFYMSKIKKPSDTGGYTSPEEDRRYNLDKTLQIIAKHEVPKDLPKYFIELIKKEYFINADKAEKEEIEVIYKILKLEDESDFKNILKKYIKDEEISDYHVKKFIFSDDSLQQLVFEEIRERKLFDKFFNSSKKFQERMRNIKKRKV